MRLPLELCEEGVVHSRHEREIPLGVGSHELPNHGLVVVLRHEASHNQVVAVGLEALLGEPSGELGVVVSERGVPDVGPVGDESRLGVQVGILPSNVLLDVLGVAHHQVGVLDHPAFRDLPVLADGRAPLGALPFVPVGVHEDLAAKGVDPVHVPAEERPDATGQHVDDGVLDSVLLNVGDAPLEGVDVVEDRPRGTDGPAQHVEAVRPVVLELADLLGGIHGARHVIFDVRRNLILGQLLHERLVAAVVCRNPLGSDDENMLH